MNTRFPLARVAALILTLGRAPSFADETEAEVYARVREILVDVQDADAAARSAAMDRVFEELAPLREKISELDSALNLLSQIREYDDWQRSAPLAAALSALAGAENEEQRQQALEQIREQSLKAAVHLTDRLGGNELDAEMVDAQDGLAGEVESSLLGENGHGPHADDARVLLGSMLAILKSGKLQDAKAVALALAMEQKISRVPGISVGPLDAIAIPQAMAAAEMGVVRDGYRQAAVVLNLVAAAMDGNEQALASLPGATKSLALTLSDRSFGRAMAQALRDRGFPFLADAVELFSDTPIATSWRGRWSSNWDTLIITEAGIEPVGFLGQTYHYEFTVGAATGDMIRGDYTSDGKEGSFTIFLDGTTQFGAPKFSGSGATVEGGPEDRPFFGHLMSR